MDRDRVYLLDILEAARLAVNYIEGVDEEAFMENVQLQDSVIRRLEIVGAAARRVSDETRQSLPGIPWTEMIGMRNLMIHDYDDVDVKVVWDTVVRDLPALIAALEPLIPPPV